MRTLKQISAALLVALCAAASVAAATQHSISHQLSAAASAEMSRGAQDNVPGDGVRRITPAEVRAALEKGEAVIVDVRGVGAYESGHIKGALSLPVDQLLTRVDELPRDKMIITYCS